MQDQPGSGSGSPSTLTRTRRRVTVDARIGMARGCGGQEMAGLECELLLNACHGALGQADQLVGLERKAPLRMAQAIQRRGLYIGGGIRSVHRLKEKVAEVKPLEAWRFGALLRENEFQFVARGEHKRRVGLRANAIQSMPGGGVSVPLVSMATSKPRACSAAIRGASS